MVKTDDNQLLSNRHLKNVYERRRPELIKSNKHSPKKMCYLNLESLSKFN